MLDNVIGKVSYIVDDAVKPAIHIGEAGDNPARTADYITRPVPIFNARALAETPSLDRAGFALLKHPTSVRDFSDSDEIESHYFAETASLVKELTGAEVVIPFDHTTRIDDERDGLRRPARHAHNDYTPKSVAQRTIDLLGEARAAKALEGRIAQINVWRPLENVVQTSPLALVDARTVAPKDLVATDLVYTDRVGEIFSLAYNPGHRWFHFPEMTPDEVLLIKGYDSADDGTAKYSPHTAFELPRSAEGVPPRKSIEIRTMAFFDL
ncbi:CmcJ/NvfI family oxidoreductase [Pelagibius sp. Alg239-R121]|uniref:CmcJ/NvfI family oxidoreductase n=1 Tax=Pelagibius sp. Alg239-R121 TaxID=2993448 RepID=UPI0024A68862|nr:CmcJ/NvfI family oxidoreductase [Pelagibius sp. Alg239-R121]